MGGAGHSHLDTLQSTIEDPIFKVKAIGPLGQEKSNEQTNGNDISEGAEGLTCAAAHFQPCFIDKEARAFHDTTFPPSKRFKRL